MKDAMWMLVCADNIFSSKVGGCPSCRHVMNVLNKCDEGSLALAFMEMLDENKLHVK